MRKVDRSSVPIPAFLSSERVRNARSEIERVLLLSRRERLQRRAPINVEIYHNPELVGALNELFLRKCAYCENAIHDKMPDIDHFRPQQVADERANFDSYHLHYAWLSYEWENLFLCCQSCNRLKRNRFPVEGRRAPLLTSIDEVRRMEFPDLIDPTFDQPDAHLDFSWNGYCRALTRRGAATIEIFSLNRSELVRSRSLSFSRLLNDIRDALSSGDFNVSSIAPAVASDRPFVGAMLALLQRFSAELAEQIGRGPMKGSDPLHKIRILADDIEARDVATVLDAAMSEENSITQAADSSFYEPISEGSNFGVISISKLPAANLAPKEISIRDFKAINDLTFNLAERRADRSGASCLMLLGENAAGKSSVLEAVVLALVGAQNSKKVVVTPSDYLRRKGKDRWALISPDPVQVGISFHGLEQKFEFNIDPIRNVVDGTVDTATLVLAYGPRRYFMRGQKKKKSNPVSRVESLFNPRATIADPTRWLSALSEEQFYAVARGLREILALNAADNVIRDEDYGVAVDISGRVIPLERMSEGYKSLFAMAVDIMRELLSFWRNLEEARGIVLIDEIETHLHPRWKMRVISGLRRAFPNVFFLVTTHDPLCLRGLEDGEVQVLRRDAEQNIERVVDLPSIKGMRADQLLTSDYFGLSSTADPETEAKLALYASLATVPQGSRTSEVDAEMKKIEQQLSNSIINSDSAAEQVVEDAIREYLHSRRGAPLPEMNAARRKAVEAVLAAFKTIPRA